jgi:hypothetical protein
MKPQTILIAAVAAVIGYVLGARAGHRRYRQLRAGARDAWNSPVVKKTVGRAATRVKKAARKTRR